jgi:hypothetical protein
VREAGRVGLGDVAAAPIMLQPEEPQTYVPGPPARVVAGAEML